MKPTKQYYINLHRLLITKGMFQAARTLLTFLKNKRCYLSDFNDEIHTRIIGFKSLADILMDSFHFCNQQNGCTIDVRYNRSFDDIGLHF